MAHRHRVQEFREYIRACNDGNEFIHGLKKFNDASCDSSLAVNGKSSVNLDIEGRMAPYWITCFSELDDNFSQWNGYSDKGRGMCIKFDLDNIDVSDKSLSILRIEYDEEKQLSRMKELCEALAEGNEEGDPYIEICRYKQSGFHTENEIRLLCRSENINLYYGNEGESRKVHFRQAAGKIIPYMEKSFKSSAVLQVTLGPHAKNVGSNEIYLKSLLNQYGYQCTGSKSDLN